MGVKNNNNNNNNVIIIIIIIIIVSLEWKGSPKSMSLTI